MLYPGNALTIVAVVDSGINLEHKDIVKRLWKNTGEIQGNGLDDDSNGSVDDFHGFDVIDSIGLTQNIANKGDPQGHGTHVAGIIAALAPKAKIMPIRMLDATGNGRLSDALFAWSYALENGAKVINNSFGVVGSPSSEFSFMEEALKLGKQKYGAVFIAAAGNQGNNNDVNFCTPANVPGMISVGSVSVNGSASTFSNYGKKSVHLFAPGEDILSADAFSLSNKTAKSGTSQAAPIVSALAANILKKNSNLSDSFVESKILNAVKSSKKLVDKSVSGGSLSSKYIKKVPQLSVAPLSRRAERNELYSNDNIVNYSRFVGVIDQTSGLTQQDVINELNCQDHSNIKDVQWFFDNIAVFTLDESSIARKPKLSKSRPSKRVLEVSRRSPAQKALQGIQRTGLFDTVEWDAYVNNQMLNIDNNNFLSSSYF